MAQARPATVRAHRQRSTAHLLRLGVLLATTALIQPRALAQTVSGTFTPQGFIDGGVASPVSYNTAMSADGSTVAGYSLDSNGHIEAFRWTNGIMTGLGFIGTGGTSPNSGAAAVSADGSVVVGYSTDAASYPEAFRWTNGTMTGLGFIRGGGASPNSGATAVSADGSVVVGYATNDASRYEAFRWTTSGMTGLGFIGTGGSSPNSGATAVNADGSVVVGFSQDTADHREAFRWTSAGMVGLGFIGSGGSSPNSGATAVSADGSVVVGYATDTASYSEAFRWTNGTMTGLGFIGTGGANPTSYANAINADGSVVVGYATNDAGNREAVLWRSGTTTALGFLGTVSLASSSSATGVSADGQVVVGFSSSNLGAAYDVFRWTAATQIKSLSSLLTAAGVNMQGFTTLSAGPGYTTLISANGQFIAGTGTDANGHSQAWIARYFVAPPPVIPDQPATPDTSSPPVIAGITNQPAIATSVNRAGGVRGGVMAQQQGLAAPLFHDDGSIFASDTDGKVYGSVGSLSAGLSGRKQLSEAFSVAGGVAYEDETYSGVRITDVLLVAGSARYVYRLTDSARLFGEGGGFWSPSGNYQFNRVYANGAGIATGIGKTRGTQLYGFVRAGIAYKVTPVDELTLSGDLGAQRMNADAYAEPLTTGNPFNAFVSGTTDSMDVAKLKLRWTHAFSPRIDASVWGTAVEGFNRGTTQIATVEGVGTFSPKIARSVGWAEFGWRLGYRVSATTMVSAFVNGVTGGPDIGTRAHFGGAVSLRF